MMQLLFAKLNVSFQLLHHGLVRLALLVLCIHVLHDLCSQHWGVYWISYVHLLHEYCSLQFCMKLAIDADTS